MAKQASDITVLVVEDDRAARTMYRMFLTHQGYTDVVNIAGGIDAWSQERDPGIPRY